MGKRLGVEAVDLEPGKIIGLAGVGDTSCWYDKDHEELQVLKGTTFFSIELGGIKNPTEPIKTAAKSVFARLQ